VFLTSNGAISWQSRKQSLIAMSTLETEFIACSEASWEAKWLLQLPKDIHGKDLPPLPINCDNPGALTLYTTGIINARTIHIDMCYPNSRDLHRRWLVNYSYVHPDENVADILTKALTREKQTKFMKAMGLRWQGGWFKVGFEVVLFLFWKSRLSLFIWMAILRLL